MYQAFSHENQFNPLKSSVRLVHLCVPDEHQRLGAVQKQVCGHTASKGCSRDKHSHL